MNGKKLFSKIIISFLIALMMPISVFAQEVEDPPQATSQELALAAITNYQSSFANRKAVFKYSGRRFTTRMSVIGYALDIDGTMQNVINQYGEENIDETVNDLIAQNQMPIAFTSNQAKLESYLASIRSILPKPKNATLRIVNGRVYYVAGKMGYQFDPEAAATTIENKINQNVSFYFYLQVIKLAPTITRAKTEAAKAQAEEWMSRKVDLRIIYNQNYHLTRHNQTYHARSGVIGQWIYFRVVDGELVAKLSRSRTQLWLAKVSRISKVKQINRLVSYVSGRKVIVRSGYNGQRAITSIYWETVITNIKAGVNTYEEITTVKIPTREIIVGNIVPGRYNGRYIEISLRQQKMYVFYGSKLLHIFPVSSGKSSTPTPRGTFRIRYKTRWTSCAPSPDYRTCYMPYSMFFTYGGHAIHALPIINGYQEGIWHLGTPVSHGCVRTHPTVAVYLYRNTPVGTPVVIHY